MNRRILTATAFLTVTGFCAAAQDTLKKQEISKPGATVNASSAIIAQLKPAQGPSQDQTGKSGWQYGLDVATTQALVPGAVGIATVWKTEGKNGQQGFNRQMVEPEKLVPLLIGALQEQMLRISQLEKEVERLNAVGKAAGY